MKKSIEKGRKTVLARSMALALMFPLAVPALAQDAPPATDEAEDTTELDAVVVTGSRIPRAEIEGPAPVVVITAEDLAAEGFTTVYEALNTDPEAALVLSLVMLLVSVAVLALLRERWFGQVVP